MRITCPNCEASYEAPDEAIGAGGRRVECSACSHQWFQPGPELTAAEGPSRMPGMSEAAAGIADLNRPEPEPAPQPAPEPEPQPSRLREVEPTQRPARPAEPERPHRRPATIDAERLSQELRARDDDDGGRRRGGAGFAVGFVIALLIGAAAAGAYLERDRVAAMAPQAAPWLDDYARSVDSARLAVERGADRISGAVREAVDGI